MKCTNCGAEIANGSTFCTYCGAGVTQPQAPAYQDAYYPAANYNTEITEDQLPAKFKPMGAWSYFGHSLLFSLPIVGLVLLIVFSVGGTSNINKRNYARSYFCALAIYGVILLIAVILLLIFGTAAGISMESMASSYY